MKLFSDGGIWLIMWEANIALFPKKKEIVITWNDL